MNKSELIWIIIRFTGLFLALKALIILPNLISNLQYIYFLGPDISNEIPGFQLSLEITVKEVTKEIMYLLLYGIGAFYLIFRGAVVFKLVRIPHKDNENSNQ